MRYILSVIVAIVVLVGCSNSSNPASVTEPVVPVVVTHDSVSLTLVVDTGILDIHYYSWVNTWITDTFTLDFGSAFHPEYDTTFKVERLTSFSINGYYAGSPYRKGAAAIVSDTTIFINAKTITLGLPQ